MMDFAIDAHIKEFGMIVIHVRLIKILSLKIVSHVLMENSLSCRMLEACRYMFANTLE